MEKYLCEICGKKHDIYYGVSSPEPDFLFDFSEEEREKRVEKVGFLLLINRIFLIVKGTIFIEVKDISKWVYFEVWARIEIEHFQKKLEEEENGNYDNPLFGKLENELYIYKNTKDLKVEIFFPAKEDEGDDVTFEIFDKNHAMFVDQKNGISKEKIIGWMQDMNHPKPNEKDSKKESFQVGFEKIIKKAKTDYLAKQKIFIIDVAEWSMLLFQIVSPTVLDSVKTEKGFVIYLPFDTSGEEAKEELERFKKTTYFEVFELDVFDGMPTYYLAFEDEKKLIKLCAKIIKDVYQVEVEKVEFDIMEP
ncbi:MAG: hypothetical protein ACJAT4_003284 [Granulosicoccus sp.]|jgi:hypothetical protein